MEITKISFSGSNPSVGPEDNSSKNTLENLKQYSTEIESLLNNTTVNGLVSLREYLTFQIEGNSEKIREIHEAYVPRNINKGERIVNLEFEIEGHGEISLQDLRTFKLEGQGYIDFQELMRKHGTVHTKKFQKILIDKEQDDSTSDMNSKETNAESERLPKKI